ncbi:A/G-specific adenine glycosylase [soil metagenome]
MTEKHEPSAQEQGAQLAVVREGILLWFDRNIRDLPWRRSRDPYQVLVSEVMLQQTQVDRVIPYFQRFLAQFPTVYDLAAAPTAEVIRLWAGLGYNRRAVNLQRTARVIVDEHTGQFPREMETMKGLPGIGDYTAGAIACFAFEQDVSFLDTNMRRVIERVFFGAEPDKSVSRNKAVREKASRLMPAGDSWRWNQALIEFGALQCTARKPLCVVCPIQAYCCAFPAVQTYIRSTRRTRDPVSREDSFTGSNRYYRGRVIDALRKYPDDPAGVSLEELGAAVRDDFSYELLPWLDTLVRGLQKDGLASIAELKDQYDATGPSPVRVKLP